MQLRFLCSATAEENWPKGDLPEVALAGRSNAGKSTFLNILGHQKVAKVSQVPGKTRLLNFFQAGEKYRLVDMPGYGFASRSGDEVISWGPMVESYVQLRSQLVGLILVIDIRRDWTEEENQIYNFATAHNRNVAVVLTKADKLSKSELAQRKKHFKETAPTTLVFVTSSQDPKSVAAVEDFVFHHWVKGAK
jgi:GTP-binding protein